MILNFSRGDLLAGQPIAPNYYKGQITSEKFVTEGDRIDLVIILNFEDPTLAADERTQKHTFYNAVGKGKGFLVPYMAALLNKSVKEVSDGLEKGQVFPFDCGEDHNVGKSIQFKLINTMFEGRPQNKVETFLPYSMEAPV